MTKSQLGFRCNTTIFIIYVLHSLKVSAYAPLLYPFVRYNMQKLFRSSNQRQANHRIIVIAVPTLKLRNNQNGWVLSLRKDHELFALRMKQEEPKIYEMQVML